MTGEPGQTQRLNQDDYLVAFLLGLIIFGVVAWLFTELFFDFLLPHWFAKMHVPIGAALSEPTPKTDMSHTNATSIITVVFTFWGGAAITLMWAWRNINASIESSTSQMQAEIANTQAETARMQAEVALKTQISTDLAKAYEQLGHAHMAVRIGAIYTLEKVMRDVQDTDFNLYWSIIETLSGFARNRSREIINSNNISPSDSGFTVVTDSDICAFLGVIGRRKKPETARVVNCKGLYLVRCGVPSDALNFTHCDFEGSYMSNIQMSGKDFENSSFFMANLSSGNFRGSNFRNSKCSGSDFSNAWLEGADFAGAEVAEDQFRSAITDVETVFPWGPGGPSIFAALRAETSAQPGGRS